MVVRLWGTCNGADIICTPAAWGRWETTVPAAPDGTYIIALWAEDEAGNQGYFATIKLTFDPSRLCFAVEILDVGTGFTVEDVKRVLMGDRFRTDFSLQEFSCGVMSDPVQSEIIRCEVCGQ